MLSTRKGCSTSSIVFISQYSDVRARFVFLKYNTNVSVTLPGSAGDHSTVTQAQLLDGVRNFKSRQVNSFYSVLYLKQQPRWDAYLMNQVIPTPKHRAVFVWVGKLTVPYRDRVSTVMSIKNPNSCRNRTVQFPSHKKTALYLKLLLCFAFLCVSVVWLTHSL